MLTSWTWGRIWGPNRTPNIWESLWIVVTSHLFDKFGSSFDFRLFNPKATIVDCFLSPREERKVTFARASRVASASAAMARCNCCGRRTSFLCDNDGILIKNIRDEQLKNMGLLFLVTVILNNTCKYLLLFFFRR